MSSSRSGRRVLIVSCSDRHDEFFRALLPQAGFSPVLRACGAGEARQTLARAPADVLIVDAPLRDELGVDFALSAAGGSAGVLLLVKSELFDKVCYKVEDSGVLTLAKPTSRRMFLSGVHLAAALSARLQKMETKNRTLQEKMADIRAVNRAKWLLIEKLNMSEKDAHYFIEKRAMDARIPRREVAESIIRTYDA